MNVINRNATVEIQIRRTPLCFKQIENRLPVLNGQGLAIPLPTKIERDLSVSVRSITYPKPILSCCDRVVFRVISSINWMILSSEAVSSLMAFTASAMV